MIKCFFGFHNYKIIKKEVVKKEYYVRGISGLIEYKPDMSPVIAVIEFIEIEYQCIKCNKIKFTSIRK